MCVLRCCTSRPRLAAVLQQFDCLILCHDGFALQVRDVEFRAGFLQSQWHLHRFEEVEDLFVEDFEEGDLDGAIAGVGALLHVPEDVSHNPRDDAACTVIALGKKERSLQCG